MAPRLLLAATLSPAVLLALMVTCVAASERSHRAPPLRPMSVCLDPQRARSWHLIDSDELLVDAGRQRFHLQLSYACPELTYNHTVEFTAGNGVGRLCGSSGDSVATVSSRWRRARCEISVVTPLEKVAYASYLKGVPEGVVETRDPEQDLPQAPSD